MVLGKYQRTVPRAEDLNLEEIDYELEIRDLLQENASLDTAGKQRLLRIKFKEDQQDLRNYLSKLNIRDEVDHIEARVETLAKALERKVETKFESRVLHYWYRAKRCLTTNDEEKEIRKDLVAKIEKVMRNAQIGPISPIKSKINSILQGEEDLVKETPEESEVKETGKDTLLEGAVGFTQGFKPNEKQLEETEIDPGSLVDMSFQFPEGGQKVSPKGSQTGTVPKSTKPKVHGDEVLIKKSTMQQMYDEFAEMERKLQEYQLKEADERRSRVNTHDNQHREEKFEPGADAIRSGPSRSRQTGRITHNLQIFKRSTPTE